MLLIQTACILKTAPLRKHKGVGVKVTKKHPRQQPYFIPRMGRIPLNITPLQSTRQASVESNYPPTRYNRLLVQVKRT